MRHLFSSLAIVTIATVSGTLPAIAAGSFTVSSGTTTTTAQTLTGTQAGTIASGGTLATSGSSVTLGAATGSGIVLDNEGTISSSTKRGIDTSGASGTLTVINNGTINTYDDGFRLNDAFTNGLLNLTNTGTITSATGQGLDFDTAIDPTAVVNINNSGTIETGAGGSDAVRLGGGTITLTNSGTIESDASGKRAIKFDTDSNVETLRSLTIDNLAGGSITSDDDAIKIDGDPASTSTANIAITNAGTIKSSVGQGIDLGDLVSTGLAISITNQATGLITSADNDAIAAGMNTTVYNYGQIISNYTTTSADAQNYDGVKFDGTSGTVINYAGGIISGAYHGIKASGLTDNVAVTNYGSITGRNGSGVNSNGTGSVVNYGTITGEFDPAASFGDGDGIDIDHIGTITNYGTIQALGSKGIKPGETTLSTSEGIAIGGGVITNGSAAERTALISGANNGILADDSNGGSVFGALTVTNYGTIKGLNGYGVRVVNDAGYSTTITNYGTISGTTYAVEMGDGNDLFTYEAGSAVNGAVLAQGGTDTLRLGETAGTFDLSLLGDSATYQGFEALDLAGNSSWTVTGSSDFSGTTTVTNAVLNLDNASLASSAFQVRGNGAVLAGNGTVGTTTIGSGTTLSPTGASGRITVEGDLALESGSTYAVDISNDGKSGMVSVDGSALLAGGSALKVNAVDGSQTGLAYKAGRAYTVVSASGGVTGAFTTVSDNFAYLDAALSYDADNVYVTLARNVSFPFSALASTPNQKAVANAVDAMGSGTLFDAVLALPDGEPAAAFDALSGEVHGAITNSMLDRSRLFSNAIEDRMRSTFDGVGSGLNSTAVAAYGDDGIGSILGDDRKQPSHFWISGLGGWSRYDGDSGSHDLDVNGGGVSFGADQLTDNGWRLGLAGGYERDNFSQDDLNSNGDSDTYRIAAYGGQQLGPLGLRFGGAYGWSSINTDRSVSFSGFSDNLHADYDARTAQAFAEAGWRVDRDLWHVEPFANLAFINVNTDGFTERGGAAALTVDGESQDQWQTTIGARIDRDIAINGVLGKVSANVGWQHVLGDIRSNTTMAFAGGDSFGISSIDIARDSALIGLGLQFEAGKASTVSLNYSGQFNKNGSDGAISGTLNVKF
jgi:subtilase-type serine protease